MLRQAELSGRTASPRRRSPRGVVLLEVLLAMSLFFAAAAVITSGLAGAIRAVKSVRLETRAANLAVTLLSEIQMGLIAPADDGPNTYDDDALKGWAWQIATDRPDDIDGMLRVQVIITNADRGYTYRLVQLMSDPEATDLGEPLADLSGSPGNETTPERR